MTRWRRILTLIKQVLQVSNELYRIKPLCLQGWLYHQISYVNMAILSGRRDRKGTFVFCMSLFLSEGPSPRDLGRFLSHCIMSVSMLRINMTKKMTSIMIYFLRGTCFLRMKNEIKVLLQRRKGIVVIWPQTNSVCPGDGATC